MKSFSDYAAYLVKQLWTLAAVLLVFIAVSISLLRYTLPYLDNQKAQLENWLSHQYGVELAIGELSAGWSGIGPTLVLREVELKQSERSPVNIFVEETQVEVDFWGSIIDRQINSRRFELNGMHLFIDLARIQRSNSGFPIVDALQSLFLEQLQHFSVMDSHVEVKTASDSQLIDIQRLSWVNSARRHQGIGQMRVVELASNSASFGLDLFGEIDSLNGTFYAKGEELDLAPWINQLVKSNKQLTASRGNFVLWAGIEDSQLTDVQVDLGDSQFAWESEEAPLHAAIKGGFLRAVPVGNEWQINVDNLAVRMDDQSLISSWRAKLTSLGALQIHNVSDVNIAALLPLTSLFLDEVDSGFIDRLDPQATVTQAHFHLGRATGMLFRIKDLGWDQVDKFPGTEGLEGQLIWHNGKGSLSLQGANQTLEIDNLLERNLPYQSVSVIAELDRVAQGLEIHVPSLRFDSEVVSFDYAMHFATQTNQLTISAVIEPLSVQQAKALFPQPLMGANTYDYLNAALHSGKINEARIIWSGDPMAFPFDQRSGVFQAAVSLDSATMKFNANWPALEDLALELLFENDGLHMRGDAGRLQQVQLHDLQALIPRLNRNAILTIDATGSGTGEQLRQLMMASNLADSVGMALDQGVQVGGLLSTALNLHIPLSGTNVVASGTVNLNENDLRVPALDLTFANASGQISFINDKVAFEAVDAKLFEQPVTLAFTGENTANGYVSDISMSGNWQVAPFLTSQQTGLSQFISGSSAFTTKVNLNLKEGEQYDYTFSVSSDLQGLQATLPAPFAKSIDHQLPLTITGKGNQQASSITATLGQQVKFTGLLPHSEMQFSRAHLSLGNSEFVGMGLGFSISADMEELDFAAWYDAIGALVTGLPDSEKPLLGAPQRIFADIQTLNVLGYTVNDLELVAKQSDQYWQLAFNAEQARATMLLHQDWDNKGIDITADFVDFNGPVDGFKNEAELTSNKQLPPIKFSCKQCSFFDKNLGRVDLTMSKSPTGMQIDNLQIVNSDGVLRATGDWLISDEATSTQLKGEIRSSDFGSLLKRFDINSGIKDSGANFAFDFDWQAAPHKFGFDTLNGNINWRLSDGYLTEVSDKGSRIFSILSLQSLVRKLSLDFRDVFAKGFFYDKMGGSFQMQNGLATTTDTVIDGGAGEMTIKGYTDLAAQTLNYQISFAPNVTSSLPLLVYWMVNPATAIAALAIDQVLTETKVISNVRYSLTGTIEEPVLSELGRKSKEISLPARSQPKEQPVTGSQGPTASQPAKVRNSVAGETNG